MDQDWTKGSKKSVFHICDAPAHGREYQQNSWGGDRFPDGDPDGHDLKKLMAEFKSMDIQYNFIRISPSTVNMEKAMGVIYPGMQVTDLHDAAKGKS